MNGLFAAVIAEYSVETATDVNDVLDVLQSPAETLYERASLIEGIAEATWRVLQARGVVLPASSSFWFAARPFDDGTSRLVICSATTLACTMIWPRRGSLQDWTAAVHSLATQLEVYAAASAPSGPN